MLNILTYFLQSGWKCKVLRSSHYFYDDWLEQLPTIVNIQSKWESKWEQEYDILFNQILPVLHRKKTKLVLTY